MIRPWRIGAGLLLSLLSTLALPGQYVDVQIVNHGGYDQRIEVIDNICKQVVLERRIVSKGILAAQICARGMGEGDLSIRNLESGAVRRYQNVHEGDRIKTP